MLTVVSLLSSVVTIGLLTGVSLKVITLLFPDTAAHEPDPKVRKA